MPEAIDPIEHVWNNPTVLQKAVDELKAKGWTQADFAKALKDLLELTPTERRRIVERNS